MCGIFGSFNVADADESLCSVLQHRGPDGAGYYHDPVFPVALGHNRLSIIDLSDAGHQPMCNEDKTVWITFNGEIYNFQELRPELEAKGHIFGSNTDTEVIIHAYEEWGKDCLLRFNGMFAFCIWDRNKKLLFLARDRLGIKPLYYSDSAGRLIFGSEPKVILSHPGFQRGISNPALISYLIYRYVAGGQSIWKGIKKLLPGHCLSYDLEKQKLTIHQYWSLKAKQKKRSKEEALDRFNELFTSAVKYRLISDVPVGVFLSGGVDSSAITGVASQLSPHINTFSIGFSESNRSELDDARVVADHLKTTHHQAKVNSGNISDLKSIFATLDEPLGDSSIIPTYLVCREGRKYAKVILAGDGGDELMGGYNWYTQFRQIMMIRPIAMLLGPALGMLGRTGRLVSAAKDPCELYRQLTSPRFSLGEIQKLFPHVNKEDFPESENYLLKHYYRNDLQPYKRWQYVDAHTFMTDDILAKVDRASMANSLEVRVPFLDHRLVEFAFALPDNLCINRGEKKYLLKEYLKKRVPSKIINKPKQGFSCPITTYWPIKQMIQEVDDGMLLQNGMLAKAGWMQLRNQKRIPYRESKIWLIAVLEKWAGEWLYS